MWCPALCREQTQLGKGKMSLLCIYIGAGGDVESGLQRTVHVKFQTGNFSIREESQQKQGSENILVYKRDRWYSDCGLTTCKEKTWRLPFFVNVIPDLTITTFYYNYQNSFRFCFLYLSLFLNPTEFKKTVALICTRKQQTEACWYL